jgi:hypothetical protein
VVIVDHQPPHVQPFKGQGPIKNPGRNEKGELLFADPPALLLFRVAKARGYLGAGFSPSPAEAL